MVRKFQIRPCSYLQSSNVSSETPYQDGDCPATGDYRFLLVRNRPEEPLTQEDETQEILTATHKESTQTVRTLIQYASLQRAGSNALRRGQRQANLLTQWCVDMFTATPWTSRTVKFL